MYLFTMSQSFGEWIKKLRETHGWTVQLCADRASMKWEAWARLEKDEPRRQNGEAPQRSRSTARAVAAGLLVSENEALKRAGYDSDENTGHLNEIQAIVDSLGEDDAEELLMIARLKLKRHKSRGKPSGANGKEDVPQYTLPPSRVQFDLVEQKLYNAEGQPADEGLQNKFRSAVGRLFLDEDIVTLTQEQKTCFRSARRLIPLPPINNVQACFDTVTHCALSLKRTPDPDALSNLDGLRADLLPAYEQLRGVQRAEYAVAIWRYCLHRGLYNEGLRMLLDSGAAFMKYPWPLRLEACIAMGVLYRRIAMFTEAHNYLHQAWRIVQVVEVPCDKAFIQQQFAQIAIELGQFDKAVEYLEVSRNFACKDNDQWMLGVIAQQRATIHLQCQELNEANVLFLQALNLFTAIGEHRRALDAQINRALVAAEMGYYEVAENTYRTCLNICRKLNDPWMLALCFHNLGDACIQTQKYEEAQTNLNLAYHQMKNLGRMSMLPVVLRALAGVYFKTNDYPNALRLYSFVEHVQAQANMTPTLYERRQMNEALAVIRLKMRANTIKTYQNQGKRLTQQMVERLLNL